MKALSACDHAGCLEPGRLYGPSFMFCEAHRPAEPRPTREGA